MLVLNFALAFLSSAKDQCLKNSCFNYFVADSCSYIINSIALIILYSVIGGTGSVNGTKSLKIIVLARENTCRLIVYS